MGAQCESRAFLQAVASSAAGHPSGCLTPAPGFNSLTRVDNWPQWQNLCYQIPV